MFCYVVLTAPVQTIISSMIQIEWRSCYEMEKNNYFIPINKVKQSDTWIRA